MPFYFPPVPAVSRSNSCRSCCKSPTYCFSCHQTGLHWSKCPLPLWFPTVALHSVSSPVIQLQTRQCSVSLLLSSDMLPPVFLEIPSKSGYILLVTPLKHKGSNLNKGSIQCRVVVSDYISPFRCTNQTGDLRYTFRYSEDPQSPKV